MSSNTGSSTRLKKLMQGKSSHTQDGKRLSNALELLKEAKKQEKKKKEVERKRTYPGSFCRYVIFNLSITGKVDLQAEEELEGAEQEQRWQSSQRGSVEDSFDDAEQCEIDDDPSADLDDDDLGMGGKSEEDEGDEDEAAVVAPKPKSAHGKRKWFKSRKSDAVPPTKY